MSKVWILISALAVINVCTAFSVIYTKHLSRQRYAQISQNQQVIDELEVQWSQLQIEESTFSEHGLVDRTARDRLEMVMPNLKGIVMITRHP